MATAPIPIRQSHPVAIYGFLVLSLLNIGLERWAKGSVVTTVVNYAFLVWVPIWLSVRIRTGYLRRKPYWTRESWQRHLRLTALPVGALVVLFTFLYFFDSSRSTFVSTFGSPQSVIRTVWAIVMLALMGFGTFGLVVAIDWMARGEPSEQFTRTRWFRRPGPSPIAN